jgi:predicted lipoprotein with Yx(FWY)xxD motif
MRKIYVATALLAGLAGVSACGSQAAPGPADVAAEQVPVAVQDSAAPVNPQGPGELPELAGADAAPPAAEQEDQAAQAAEPAQAEKQANKATAPTVAKTQRWVKIFSGPSNQDITPPKSRTAGSKTVELNTTDNAQIGTYVTDGAGRTLYRFDNDSNKPPKTTCKGDCATAWPPLLIHSPGKIFPDGVDPKIVGFVERGDGTCQVTINGWPVYYFVADNKAGDINGQGLNGKWFAIKPDGGKTAATPGPLASNGTGQ